MYIEQIIQFTAFVWQQDYHHYSNKVVSFFVTCVFFVKCLSCSQAQRYKPSALEFPQYVISSFFFLFIQVEVFTKGSNSFFIYKHLIPFCCQPYWFQYTCTCTVNPLETVHYRYNRHTAHSVLF